MTLREQIIHTMTTMQPVEARIVDGCGIYASTTRTHSSYGSALLRAKQGTIYERMMLERCYDWLKLLKKNNIALRNVHES